jgi:hypothetical protein
MSNLTSEQIGKYLFNPLLASAVAIVVATLVWQHPHLVCSCRHPF